MLQEKIVEFYGSEISVFISDASSFVGAKSLVDGMTLDWPTQYVKIKSRGWHCYSPKRKINNNQHKRCLIHTGLIPNYFETFDFAKIPEEKKSIVKKYKSEFPGFIFKQVKTEKEIDLEEDYLGTKKGLRNLILDSIIVLGNDNAIAQLSDIIYSLLTENILSIDDLYILDPIYDMAEKSSVRHKEIMSIKSKSPGARLEIISQQVRKYDANLALAITKIAKEVFN